MTRPDSEGQAGRPPAGQIATSTLADGTRAFRLRFQAGAQRERMTLHERRDCPCGCGGGWNERTARVELDNILGRVRAGVWPSRLRAAHAAASTASERVPTFHEYASWWLTAKTEGVIGDTPIDANTQADYRWRLTVHLLPFFGEYRLDEIDRRCACASRRPSCASPRSCGAPSPRARSCATGAAGGSRPLGLASIKKLIDDARRHPRRGHRGRAHRAQPSAWERMRIKRAQAHRARFSRWTSSSHSSMPPASRTSPWIARSLRPAKGSTARAPQSPRRGTGHAPKRHRGRACARQGHRELPPGPLGGRGAGDYLVVARSRHPRTQRRPRQRAVRPARRRRAPSRPRRCTLPNPRRQDRGRHPRGADEPRARRGVHPALRPPAPRRPAHRPRRLRLSQHPRRTDHPSTRRARRRRGRHARLRASQPARPAAAAPHHAAHAAPHLHLDRAARQPLRRPLGHGPGRPRRLEDDARRLRPAAAARQARARPGLRHPRQAGARAALRHHQRAPTGGARAQFRPRVGPRGHLERVRRPEGRADRRAGNRRLAGGSRNGETRTRTGDTTIFSRAVPASESNLFPGNFSAFRNVCGVRAFPDFASVCRALRQTAVPVCLFVARATYSFARSPRPRSGATELAGPQLLDEPVSRHDALRAQQQNGEQRPLLRAAEREPLAVCADLKRAENAEVHVFARTDPLTIPAGDHGD